MKETLVDMLEARQRRAKQGAWMPANGGTEQPFEMRGYRLQYLFQQSTGRHAYVNCDTDVLLTDEEVNAIFLR
jgi:hypothetical protein